jgi:hypothetical protein
MRQTASTPNNEVSTEESGAFMPLADRLAEVMTAAETAEPHAAEPQTEDEPQPEEASAASMAQRFAPEPKLVSAPDLSAIEFPVPPLQAQPRDRVLAPAPGWRPLHVVLVGLSVAAMIPATAFGVLLWQGAIDLPAAPSLPPKAQQASLAPGPETVLPKQAMTWSRIALAAPAVVEIEAGKPVPFDIAIDSDDRLPSRAVLAVHGLPAGAAFSKGRPFGEAEWTLTPEETDGLTLSVPQTAGENAALELTLVAADGSILATAHSKLSLATGQSPALVLRPEEAARISDFIEHGHKMIEVGYFAGARAYFRRAAEAGSGEGALALGATYDPRFIAEVGAHGIQPNSVEARSWYERARDLGAAEADARLKGLEAAQSGQDLAAEAPAGWVNVASAAEPETADAATDPATGGDADPENAGEPVELAGAANLREGPSSNAGTIRVAPKGTKLRSIGREGGWVQIYDPETARTGWVFHRLLVDQTAEAR